MPIKEQAKEIAEAAINSSKLGLVVLASMELITRVDKFFNPQIIEALKNNFHWWQYFTTNHALTNLYLTHEPWSAVGAFAIPTLILFGEFTQSRSRGNKILKIRYPED